MLGTVHEGQPFPHYKRTRWNNRSAGQGRFPNKGTIRVFGNDVHVALRNPNVSFVGTKDEVLELLRGLNAP